MSKPAAAYTIVLHSHLPWVLHHGRWPHGVDWLNEAAAETYLPLWRVLHERTQNGGGDGGGSRRSLGITLGLSPVLCEQLAHPDFHREFVDYLEQKIGAAAEDRNTFTRTGEDAMSALAQAWERFYRSTLEDFMGPHGQDLVRRFRRLEEKGAIEIITCGATHGYLPLLGRDSAIEGQVRVARTVHRRHFGRDPRGIWLPECAYRPAGPWTSPLDPQAKAVPRRGIEEVLESQGLRYFFVDRHLLSGGRPLGVYADRFEALRHVVRDDGGAASSEEHTPYRAYRVGKSRNVAVFGRDPHTALQVWSGEHGYPGAPPYLDFHKKRFPGGHRYWSVTHPKADLAHKTIYRPGDADRTVLEHAGHFIELVTSVARENGVRQSEPALVCAMYDAELFGHWWFEGPRFLAAAIDRGLTSELVPVTAGEYLERNPPREAVALPEGSWGDGGGHQVWLNEGTRWTWGPVHAAEGRFETLAQRGMRTESEPLLERLLAQLGRELMLLEASDWQFLITTVAARDYAELRVAEHAEDFARLAGLTERRLEGGALSEADEQFVRDCEARDSLFPDFDWRGYAATATPASATATR